MNLLKITIKAWKARKLSIALSISAIALGMALFLGIEKLRIGIQESFTGMISKTDLVIGARTSPIDLILSTVFHIGSVSKNIEYKTFQKIQQKPSVKWAIPISLGDSHKGFRVVGTSQDLFQFFRYGRAKQLKFDQGRQFKNLFDVVIGAEVAKSLNYQPEESIVLAHGISKKALVEHKNTPFKVVGILKPTFTPIDKSILVSLKAIEAIHAGWENGIPPLEEEQDKHVDDHDKISVNQISAFYLGLKSRMQVLTLQRDIINFKSEPLTAAMPALVLANFWKSMGYIESALKIVSGVVVIVSLLTMLISIYSSLSERRREMSIYRAIGVGPKKIFSLFLLESINLTVLGLIIGWLLTYLALLATAPLLEKDFGIYIALKLPSSIELFYTFILLLAGFVVGFIPAYRAYKNSLIDGLTIRV